MNNAKTCNFPYCNFVDSTGRCTLTACVKSSAIPVTTIGSGDRRIGMAGIMEQLIGLQEENKYLKKELSSYRQAEEQGLLLRLPCKVGDTVYWVNSYHDETGRKKINSVQVQCYTWWLTHGFCVKIANLFEEIPCVDKAITEFGKTLFLTREAAEEALQKGAGE